MLSGDVAHFREKLRHQRRSAVNTDHNPLTGLR